MLSLKTISKYASVNAILLPVNFAIAWGLTEVGVHYLVATVIGFAFQITTAFFINDDGRSRDLACTQSGASHGQRSWKSVRSLS